MTGTALSCVTLAIGQRWRSHGRTLTEADLAQSCMTSGDWHPIHADAVHAAATPLGQRIFQGSYGLHVALGMATGFPGLGEDVIGALGLSEWRFQAPLYVGDTVYVEIEVTNKRRTSDGLRAVVERRIRLVRNPGEAVQQGLMQTLIKLNPSEEKQ